MHVFASDWDVSLMQLMHVLITASLNQVYASQILGIQQCYPCLAPDKIACTQVWPLLGGYHTSVCDCCHRQLRKLC